MFCTFAHDRCEKSGKCRIQRHVRRASPELPLSRGGRHDVEAIGMREHSR
ncbi:hypothetical protein HMPREF1980_00761 [Actinomyces sp. oral taxon 172 str. F0311]|nr:hypothetical protein HMPREF1980_00761 [Actinomyces sp. oral taxon 172 str. F0311]